MKETWNVAVLASKDPKYLTEFDAFVKDIENVGVSHNIRFVFFEFDGNPEHTLISKYLFTGNRSEEKAPGDCNDLYNPQHLITFFKTHVVVKDSETETNRYIVITHGHGAGLGVLAKLEPTRVPENIKAELISNSKDGHESFNIASSIKDFESKFDLLSKQNNQIAYLTANSIVPKLTTDEIKMIPEETLKFFNDKITENPVIKPLLNEFENFRIDYKERTKFVLTLLTGQDLNFIFSNSFEKKIDVLITINCFTQMFELGLGLKDSISLLVAPQTMIPFYGVNYAPLFSLLNNAGPSSLSLMAISKNITSYFWPKYIQPDIETIFKKNYPDFKIEDTSFCCNSLGQYSALDELIGEVGQKLNALKDKSIQIRGIISEARKKCRDLSPSGDYGVVDFTLFFQNVLFGLKSRNEILADQDNMTVFVHLNALFYKLIMDIRKNSNLSIMMCEAKNYVALDIDNNIQNGIDYVSLSPFFISIFFPDNKKSIMQDLLRPKLGSLTRAVQPLGKPSYKDWSDFVIDLFNS